MPIHNSQFGPQRAFIWDNNHFRPTGRPSANRSLSRTTPLEQIELKIPSEAQNQSHFARWIGILAVALVAILFTTGSAFAQSAGQISGVVTDPTGALVPGATVTLTNTDTNAVRTTKANNDALYDFTNVQPGSYSVTATSAGFSAYSAKVIVTVGGHFTVDAKLTLATNTVVEVSADQSVQVNTSSPEVSQVITQEQISQLPSLTRNPYDFIAVSGNVSNGDNTASGAVQNGANRGVNFSINGQRNSGTEILLDGVENIAVFGEGIGILVPIDGVQEYRVITNNFAAEYGRASGGVVAVATKSGTNSFHGSAWEFNRLAATTANTFTNSQTGVAKGGYTRNQFGGAVGGPIVKDKLFFYGGVEFTRVRSGAPNISVVPTPQFLSAASSNIQSFFSTYAGPTSATVLSQTTNLQAGGGTNPLYSTLAPSLPVFNVVSFVAPGDAGGGLPQNTYNILGRVDYNWGQKTQTFFRYVNYHEIDQLGAAFASPYSQYNVGSSNVGQAYLWNVSHEFNAALSSNFKLSFTRTNVGNTYNTALQNVPTLFVASGAQDPYSGRPFQLPGFYDTNPGNGGLPFGGPQNTIQFNPDVTWVKGRHTIQAGAGIIYIQMNNGYGAYAQANEQLGNSQATGLQNLLTGNLFEFQAAVNPKGATPCSKNAYTGALTQTAACTITLPATAPSFARSDRYHDWATYVQDQWKMTPKVTLSYGLRYEYFGVQHNNNPNLDANFYYGAGPGLPSEIRNGSVLTVPNSPIGKLWNPQYGTVSPRLGFAYDVFGNGKTSIRGGYGISYERNFGNVTFNLIQNPPNYAVVVIKPSAVTNSNAGPLAGGSGSVALPPTSLRHVDQNIRTAQTQFHSLSVDQQLTKDMVLEVSYNGARGIHLYDIKNYNIPGSGNLYLGDPIKDPVSGNTGLTSLNSHFSNDNNRGSSGDSYYNSLQFQLNSRNIHRTGVSVVASYTYAHALDDLSTTFSETAGSSAFTLGYTNPFNPGLDHGNSDFDIRHRFVLAPIYQTPYFAGKSTLLGELLGGYEITGIYTVRTGTPFNYYDSTNDNSGYGVPRYNPITPVTQHTFKSIPKGATSTSNTYALTGPTTLPVDNPFGNAALLGISDLGPYPSTMVARNSFRGPGAYNLTTSVSKKFPIHEQVNLELRAEAFNVTNHHNLYIQETQLDGFNSVSGGGNPQIYGSKGGVTGGPNDERRFLQFAGRINF
jgi:hypothetical protein